MTMGLGLENFKIDRFNRTVILFFNGDQIKLWKFGNGIFGATKNNLIKGNNYIKLKKELEKLDFFKNERKKEFASEVCEKEVAQVLEKWKNVEFEIINL